MSGERWRFVKEREQAGGGRVRLYVCGDRYKRTVERSRAIPRFAKVRGEFVRGSAWCVVEFCERGADGEPTPWREAWSWD